MIWSECIANRVLVTLAMVLFVLDFPEILRLLPMLRKCLGGTKANLDLEHQLGAARSRNLSALICTLPFCLILDRYGVYPLWLNLNPGWSFVGILVTLIAFLVFRMLLYILIFNPRSMDQEIRLTVRRTLYSVFIPLTLLCCLSVGIMFVFKASDAAISCVIKWETIAFYLIALLRSLQISARYCSPLSTILYLCALEVLPLGLLVLGIML